VEEEKVYYIVNPAGAVHVVPRGIAAERLKQRGFRMATPAEIAAYEKAGGNQRFDKPLAEPWSPEPEDEVDLSGGVSSAGKSEEVAAKKAAAKAARDAAKAAKQK